MLAVEPKAIQGVAAQLGRLLNVTGVRSGDRVAFCLFVSSASFAGNFTSRTGNLIFSLQGKFSKQTLNEIGTFLRYMETQNNVKVRAKFTSMNVLPV